MGWRAEPPRCDACVRACRYVDRLAGALARKAGQEAKMHAAAKGAVQRGHEAKAQLVDCSRKVRSPCHSPPPALPPAHAASI